ncbi:MULTISPECIES: hypothetical protein [Bacillus]|uniref:hypothetical protein n=1 Tax=Bacillus TaxID=1386 RepID=UPI0002F897AE|nr:MULTISPECIES: hypothetical protein [Bacillus]
MPVINDATVINSPYQTLASARPQLLSNGWIIIPLIDTANNAIKIYVTKDNFATTPTLLTQYAVGSGGVSGLSVASKGTKVYLLYGYATASIYTSWFDVTTVGATFGVNKDMEASAQMGLSGVSIAINETGTELHAAWSSKNSTYPNSFNIRYAKGIINSDGTVVWGTVEQVTKINNTTFQFVNPSIILDKNGIPVTFYESQGGGLSGTSTNGYLGIFAIKRNTELTNGNTNVDVNWSYSRVSPADTYAQNSPSAIFVPKNINGLANGRIWVAWHGFDAEAQTTTNIRYSYSDDGGMSWVTAIKMTTGVTPYHSQFVSITANKNNKIFFVFNYGNNVITYDVCMITIDGSTTSSMSVLKDTTSTSIFTYPSTLFDLSVNFSSPLFIYKDTAKVGFYGSWTVTNITPAQGAIGAKTDRTNLLNYAITTDGTMSTITEKVNGVVIGTKTATSGQSLTLSLTQAQWDVVKYGKYADAAGGLNTIEISMGSDKWTYTFDKRLASDAKLPEIVKADVDSNDTYLPSVKSKLITSANSKGANITAGSSFDAIEQGIKNIPLGKKWASGKYKPNTGDQFIRVSGLSFKPSVIIWFNGTYAGIWTTSSNFNQNRYLAYAYYSDPNGSVSGVGTSKNNATVTNENFTVYVGVTDELNWIAYE